jgi:hypothetical protein
MLMAGAGSKGAARQATGKHRGTIERSDSGDMAAYSLKYPAKADKLHIRLIQTANKHKES